MATASPVARVALVRACHMNLISMCCFPQVTGANQGIGLEIVRQLCRKFEGTVILAGMCSVKQVLTFISLILAERIDQ